MFSNCKFENSLKNNWCTSVGDAVKFSFHLLLLFFFFFFSFLVSVNDLMVTLASWLQVNFPTDLLSWLTIQLSRTWYDQILLGYNLFLYSFSFIRILRIHTVHCVCVFSFCPFYIKIPRAQSNKFSHFLLHLQGQDRKSFFFTLNWHHHYCLFVVFTICCCFCCYL